jgi:hypothetical protein
MLPLLFIVGVKYLRLLCYHKWDDARAGLVEKSGDKRFSGSQVIPFPARERALRTLMKLENVRAYQPIFDYLTDVLVLPHL